MKLLIIALMSVLSLSAFGAGGISILSYHNLSSYDCPFLRGPKIINNKLDYSLDLDFLMESPDTRIKKRCMFTTKVKVDDGYKMRIKRIAFGGNTTLEGDAMAKVTAAYRVLGDASPVASTGWLRRSTSFEEESPVDSNTPWSSCGGVVDIEARSDASLRSKSGTGFGDMIIQSAKGGFMSVKYECVPCGGE